jgi:hypothetical protein
MSLRPARMGRRGVIGAPVTTAAVVGTVARGVNPYRSRYRSWPEYRQVVSLSKPRPIARAPLERPQTRIEGIPEIRSRIVA